MIYMSTIQVGPSGSLYGLLGVQLVELLQSWKLIDNPCLELIKLLINITILLGKIKICSYNNVFVSCSFRTTAVH